MLIFENLSVIVYTQIFILYKVLYSICIYTFNLLNIFIIPIVFVYRNKDETLMQMCFTRNCFLEKEHRIFILHL